MGDQVWLTTLDVSERYEGKISPRTLANWRYRKQGPKFVKMGGRIYYQLEKLIEWEKNNTYQNTSEYRRTD